LEKAAGFVKDKITLFQTSITCYINIDEKSKAVVSSSH